MYGKQSLQDLVFLMIYGGTGMLALAAGIYLWLRRSNAIAPNINPPKALRRWTAAFFIVAALSHMWWYVLGVYWLTDDRLIRDITAVTLDHITLVPLVMAMLLHLLQDRQRKLWPWVLAQMPIVVFAAIGIVKHSEFYGFGITTYWQLSVMSIFVVYYIYALVQYGRWLHENYADLEHKEIWQSLLFAVVLFAVYENYFTNPGEMAREYLAQIMTLAIIAFLLWRVETLQELDARETEADAEENNTMEGSVKNPEPAVGIQANIGALLQKNCVTPQLYLQHDLTLQQLATAIGTNRTYLSAHFAQQGITYNAYINRLRIEHFIHLYRQVIADSRPCTAQDLAKQSGFSSYSTFSAAFKRFMNLPVASWMKAEEEKVA